MLKNNGAGLDNKNGISPYMSWFVKDGQELKRGGTAPINQGRKNRSNVPTEGFSKQDQNDIAIENADNTKPISVITTSKVPNPVRLGSNANNENHRITKVFNGTGISTYKLTRVANPDEDNNRPSTSIVQGFEQLFEQDSNPAVKFERKNFAITGQDEFQADPLNDEKGSMNDRNGGSFQTNRPQTAHIKGSGAFRRGRILNESSHNYEEFQTPNTGNLDLESLHELNNKTSERNIGQNVQREQKPRIGEFKNTLENRPTSSMQHSRQTAQTENDAKSQIVPRYVALQKGFGKGEEIKFGAFNKEDDEQEKANNAKYARVKTAEPKNNKAKQLIGGRRYAEDMYTYNLDDQDSPLKNDEGNQEKRAETATGNLVSMIGRSCQENINPRRAVEEENHFYGNPQKSLLDQDDQFNVLNQKSPAQRPPARKNGQAMFLNNYAGLHEIDKKAAMLSPTKGQTNTSIRPPSRQKALIKTGGLEGPDAIKMKEAEDNQAVDPGFHRRNLGGTKHDFVKDNEFGLDDDDFENFDFDQVFEIADFLEGDDLPRAQTQNRPNTSVASQRNSQNSHKPQVGASRNGFLQSAKGRPNEAYGASTLNAFLQNQKTEQSERIKTLKTQKDSTRLDSEYSANKNQRSKPHNKPKNDLEVCDILSDDNSDSNHSVDPVPKRVTTAQPSSKMSKGHSNKLLESEKPGVKPLAFKDKKSQIVFIYNKESQSKKEKIDLPFETTLEKDFVGLFAN